MRKNESSGQRLLSSQGQDGTENARISRENKRDSNKGNQNKDVNLVSEDKVDYVSFQAFSTSTYPKDQNKWIIDSSCTSHMTFERKYFIDFKPVKDRVYLAGKGNILESGEIGSIKVKLRDAKDKITCIMMHDVIYVPELRTNLLSVMKLMERRLKVNFTEYGVKICKENDETVKRSQ